MMTRSKTYGLTAVTLVVYLLLCWIFADDWFKVDSDHLWNSDVITESNIWTYLGVILIVAAGVYQASKLPEAGVDITPTVPIGAPGQVDDPVRWKLLMGNVYYGLFWLGVRFFAGREWAIAGEEKIRGGDFESGESLQGYWERANAIPEQGRPAITYDWYRDFLQYMLDHHWNTWMADVIMWGELLVGLALIAGALVGIAAFFGTFMNFNFMLAGSASSNPVLFGIAIFLILAWKVAGFWGLDRWLLPSLGTPWETGEGEPRTAIWKKSQFKSQ